MPIKKVENYYPITTITYPNGSGIIIILDEHLKEYTTPHDWPSLADTLTGQTRVAEGVYASDVEQWLNHRAVTD